MAARRQPLLEHVHRLAARLDPEADAVLLERFVRQHDNAAFEALVHRHGAMVLGVCRRVLGNVHDAEDVFQATFLVLSRKAASGRPPDSLPAWLHGVARRLALKHRQNQKCRQNHEARSAQDAGASPRDPLDHLTAREMVEALDEELQRLPEAYRLPLILCCLEGRMQEEAADILGWAPGSVKGRLQRGRALLYTRLARRGVGLGIGLLAATTLGQGAMAGLPMGLTRTTVEAALRFAVGETAGIAAGVMALAEGALRITGTKMGAVLLGLTLAVAAAGGGLGFLIAKAPETRPDKETEPVSPPQAVETRTATRVDCFGDPLPAGVVARMGTTRLRHGQQASHVLFAPDGKTVASGGGDGTVRLWDVATGKLIRSLKHSAEEILRPVAFASDGKTLISAAQRGQIWLWDVKTGQPIREWKLKLDANQAVYAMAVSSDGKTAASGEWEGVLRLWNVATGDPLRVLERREKSIVRLLSFSPDNKMLAAVAEVDHVPRQLHLWDVSSGKLLHTLEHPQGIRTISFSPDSKTLASTESDLFTAKREENSNVVRLWDTVSGKLLHALKGHQQAITSLSFSHDGKLLASGSWDRTIRLWDVAAAKELRQLPAHHQMVGSLSFAPDGKVLASGDSGPTVHLWDVATGKERHRPQGVHTGVVGSLAFAPDGRTLATVASWGEGEGNIRFWDAASGKLRRSLKHPGLVHLVVFAADGKTLASGGPDLICVWDATTGKQLRQLEISGDLPMTSVSGNLLLALSPDGKRLATGSNNAVGRVQLWEVAAGTPRRTLQHGRRILTAAFSLDGKTLAVATEDCVLHLWDMGTSKELWEFGISSKEDRWRGGQVAVLSFSADGKTLAAASWDGKIHLLEVSTGKEVSTLTAGPANSVSALAFSPSGRLLASGSKDQTVRLWEVNAGLAAPCHQFHGHDAWVTTVAFSPDSRLLASGSLDSTALVWDVSGQAGAQVRASRLTPGELTTCWQSLANTDATRAYQTMRTLAAAPDQAVPFLAEHLLRKEKKPEPQQLARILAELDSEDFQVRSKAARELEKWGEAVEPALRQALKGHVSLEVRRRVQERLDAMHPDGVSLNLLRWRRAVDVLEWINTPAARELLGKLAADPPREAVGQQAKAALKRLHARLANQTEPRP